METSDIARLAAALRTVGARLDARSQQAHAPAGVEAGDPVSCPVPCAQAQRCLDAMREAVRALELLLCEAPR